jgi:hypothetical protein
MQSQAKLRTLQSTAERLKNSTRDVGSGYVMIEPYAFNQFLDAVRSAADAISRDLETLEARR